jgi:alcohol dehydrogenase, propanol-preferring
MQAMVLEAPDAPLVLHERPNPVPGTGAVRIRVGACGVCRTDLHVVDGELPGIAYPIVPGHEVVGRVDAVGPGEMTLRLGDRVGVPWLGYTCGACRFCSQTTAFPLSQANEALATLRTGKFLGAAVLTPSSASP